MQQLQRRSFLQAAMAAFPFAALAQSSSPPPLAGVHPVASGEDLANTPRHLHKPGRLLIAFAPAGQMEAFFREVTKPNEAPMDAKTFRAYGMEHVGPPLSLL
jgi:hypothetical protein